ncbi:hypothetical protein URH17368_0950 [Alicyclobacillus hesperidum URH17-3-68]|uniref:Uncharacterized protein n=1 Tax=Alicyclobacillus hesperidum TaxID=89784 RepID=A0A1H2T021_9BACL|nr:hypothetical protein [Alicyclobacillus hesperidum]EJY56425.1 hypothetical protein URH17368_0950 [Alicyclobacillus hesperidum URH17-3-68]GLV13690.1 hypothetical protein Heshes_13740 [Alicyclobacillus hesperidum]SDW37150.1 hypothetical protein SAMN04489725_1055 [Alicyclobacillus hesperidum]
MAKIRRIFEASIEEAGDYIFTPSGVIILMESGDFQIYSESARHNLLRRTCMRYAWDQLVDGVKVDELNIRIRDITADLRRRLDSENEWTTDEILKTWYEQNPRQLFFLRRYSSSPSHTNMPPL